jgi:hypothetical protein
MKGAYVTYIVKYENTSPWELNKISLHFANCCWTSREEATVEQWLRPVGVEQDLTLLNELLLNI